jgi:predicted DNA-binding transcriptional regulator AlpA
MSPNLRPGAIHFPVEEWLDSERVAAMLGVTKATVYRYKNSGRLPADARVGETPLWHVSTVTRYRDELAPRAVVARRKRAEREALRLHSNGGAEDGTVATCAACGTQIVYRTEERIERNDDGTANGRSVGRWLDQEGGRAHDHGLTPGGA